ncbi:MAG TPA: T9SS type A sorting domain-containing protein [Flavipsychrobacter sp.]|nr:T9SS type A sorting domain-containing protein [Flavipsychrobacter sp.]
MKKIALLLSSFLCAGIVNAQMANNGLENWRTLSSGTATNLEAPNSWYGVDSLIYLYGQLAGITPAKTLYKDNSSVHGGTYAAKMETKNMTSFIIPCMLANANPSFNIAAYLANPGGALTDYLTFSGGTAVTQRYYTLTAWVKYAPSGNDVGAVTVEAFIAGAGAGGKDSLVGYGEYFVPAMANYGEITVPISYPIAGTTPNLIRVTFTSSDLSGQNGTTPQAGSIMYVDDINISTTSGIKNLFQAANFAEVFPNPASNVLHIKSAETGKLNIKIYGANGAWIRSNAFIGNTTIDLTDIAPGMYFYEVTHPAKQEVQHGRFSVVK